MKKVTLLCLSILVFFEVFAQTVDLKTLNEKLIDLHEVDLNNHDFTGFESMKDVLQDVEIILLGEQSHGEATAYETKIKLIKYLHQEMGFDIIAFESDFYACDKAWKELNAEKKGQDARLAMGKGITLVWSAVHELKPLTNYIEQQVNSDNPLELAGFDNQMIGRYSAETYLNDLTDFLKKLDNSILETEDWKHFESSLILVQNSLRTGDFKGKYTEAATQRDLAYLEELIQILSQKTDDPRASFWQQTLKNTKSFLSDMYLKTDNRDLRMADNLMWLKAQNPGKKIICWGATSHFLYNAEKIKMKGLLYQMAANYYKKQPMMGQYLKDKYGDKVYSIGFIAHEGEFGLWRRRKLKPADENSLEYLLGQTIYDNCFLPFDGLTFAPLWSRPLGNAYMKNDISEVMDGVIFNRIMRSPKLDNNFFLDIIPENKYIKRVEVKP